MKVYVACMAVVLLGVALVGCGGAGTPTWTRARLARYPEAHLAYPGATLVGETGGEGGHSIDGPFPASAGGVYGTADDRAAVEAFYARALTTRGWLSVPTGSGSTEVAAATWRQGAVTFRLGFYRHQAPQVPPELDRFTTAFSAVLLAIP